MYARFDAVGILLAVEGPKPGQQRVRGKAYDLVRILTDWSDNAINDPGARVRFTVQATAVLPDVRLYLSQCRRGDLIRIVGDVMSRLGPSGNITYNLLRVTNVHRLVTGFHHHARGHCKGLPREVYLEQIKRPEIVTEVKEPVVP